MCSIISKELRFAVLDKTCAKQSAQLCCCIVKKLKPAPLSCWSKLEKSEKRADNFEMSFSIKLVQNSVRKCAVARNWR